MKHLHLIAFNVPEPPDYGGIIDVFYRIKAFYEVGINVTLHCFFHDRRRIDALNNYCSAVYYYPRKAPLKSLSLYYPLMMKSRHSKRLIENLSKDHSPIFFEGIQTCYPLTNPAIKGRIKTIKLHNIEWKYYLALGKATLNPIKKCFYFSESYRLRHIETIFQHADHLLAVSRQEANYYNIKFSQVKRLPSFHGHREVTSPAGSGDFLLYHGNLQIIENQEAVKYLLTKVMPFISQTLIVAGKNPGKHLIRVIEKMNNVELVPSPSDEKLNQLIHDAHIHLLPTFQNTGFKIKLINTLYKGRHCLVSPEMAEGSGLEKLCHFAKNSTEFIEQINTLMKTPFSENLIQVRKTHLSQHFDDIKNAKYIKGLIFGREE